MNAVEYIATLQRQSGLDLLEVSLQSDKYKQRMRQLMEISVVQEDVINASFLESSAAWAKDHSDQICAAIRSMNLSLPVVPEIGLLPTGDFNAWATSAPDGSPICIFDGTLARVLECFGRCVAEATTAWPETVLQPDHAKCYSGVIAACETFLRGGDPRAEAYISSQDWDRDRHWSFFGSLIALAMERFVLAHEFAHHILGHVGSSVSRPLSISKAKLAIQVYSRSQLDELDADRLGASIFLKCEESRLELFQCAPFLFFDLMIFGYKYILRADDAIDPEGSHPPPGNRLQALKEHMWPYMGPQARSYFEHLRGFWRGLYGVAQYMQDRGQL